jgi:RNA polymerase sigma factor (sigma-70 family)
MNRPGSLASSSRQVRRAKQGEQLRANESDLGRLVSGKKKDTFFERIIPLLGPLREYIDRRFRVAYLERLLVEAANTSADILDEVVLSAYENFDKKPKDLSLEQWLYRLANEKLDDYFRKVSSRTRQRRSLESLAEKEENTLDEKITADAEGEVMLQEDLPDTEYHLRPEFTPPSYQSDPLKTIERQEEMRSIMSALGRFSQLERGIFELYAIEGFSDDEIAKIVGVSPEMVRETVARIRKKLQKAVRDLHGEVA